MDVTFWGVRGSIPAPGPETNRYGGNTPCIAVRSKSGYLIVVDIGTGAVPLGRSLLPSEFGKGRGEATLLLSHSQWDCIQGFAFFAPIFIPGNKITIYGQARSSSMLEGILEGQMNPHFSPIHTLKNLGATIEILAVPNQPFLVDGITVRAMPNPHGSSTALAYRLEEDGRSMVYAADVGYPNGGPPPATIEFYRDADVLVHDCTYTPEDRAARLGRGQSSYADAAAVAARAGVKQLVMFHYDQDYGDDFVDELATRCRRELDAQGATGCALTPAREGLVIKL